MTSTATGVWWRNRYLWLLLILLLGFALRAYGLGDVAFDNDEGIDYGRYVSESFQTITVGKLVLNSQALAYIFGRVAILTLGDKLFALRWPALAVSMLGVAAIYRLARGLFEVRVGIISAFLLAVSPYSIFFAQNYRGYSYVIAVPILVYLLALLALQSNKWRYWLALGLAAPAMMYAHLFTSLAFINLAVLLALLWLVKYRQQDDHRPDLKKIIISLAITGLVMAILYAPIWLKLWQPTAPTAGDDISQKVILVVRPSVTASVWYNLWLYNGFWEKGSPTGHGAIVLLGFIATALALGRNHRLKLLLMLGWALIPFAELWLGAKIFPGLWARPNYVGFTLAPLLVLAGFGLARLFNLGRQKKWRWPLAAAATTLALLVGLWYLAYNEYQRKFITADWQAIGNFLQQNATKTDLIICQQYRQPWRDIDIDPEDTCTRTLNYRRAAGVQAATAVYISHDLIYSKLPQAVASGVYNRFGRVWMVVWDAPETVDLSHTAEVKAEYHQFGRSFVYLADQNPTYIENLNQALGWLRSTVPATDPQRFIYDLMVAPLAMAAGQPEPARAALAAANQHPPQHRDTTAKLARTAALVQAFTPNPIDHPVEANFGDVIKFQGFNLTPATPLPGATVNLALFWQATGAMQENYKVFLHLRNPAGANAAQLDYEPFGGSYPTRNWQIGQPLADKQTLPLPPDLPPGRYELYLGVYNPQTMARLPLNPDASGQNTLLLTRLDIGSKP